MSGKYDQGYFGVRFNFDEFDTTTAGQIDKRVRKDFRWIVDDYDCVRQSFSR